MNAWRTLIYDRRRLVFLLLAVVLFARVFVPTGYMFTPTAGGFVVQMCSGQGAMPVVLNIDKAPSTSTEDHRDSGKMDAPCAFSGIGMAATAAVDTALLIAAIAFIVALGTRRVPSFTRHTSARLRPPLRAPPIFG
ncbi:hypothetical protein BH09PSE3_BH09PSE3_02400 [soil metagenome]